MNTSLVGQDMALRAMNAPKEYIHSQLEIWKSRRELIYQGLQRIGLDLWKPEGAFYVLPKVDNAKELVLKLYNKYRIITYPGDWFGVSNRIRLSYALDVKLIEEGLNRIEMSLKEADVHVI